MMMDKQFVLTYTSATDDSQTFSDATFSGTTGVSYYQLDMGAGQTYANGVDGATPISSFGNTPGMYLFTRIVTNDPGGHTAAAIIIQAVGATDSAFTSPRIVATTGEIAYALTPANTLIVLPVPPGYTFRYWRMHCLQHHDDNVFVVKSWFGFTAPTPYMQLGPAYLAAS